MRCQITLCLSVSVSDHSEYSSVATGPQSHGHLMSPREPRVQCSVSDVWRAALALCTNSGGCEGAAADYDGLGWPG
jgi:hypothetical protein